MFVTYVGDWDPSELGEGSGFVDVGVTTCKGAQAIGSCGLGSWLSRRLSLKALSDRFRSWSGSPFVSVNDRILAKSSSASNEIRFKFSELNL